MLLYHSSMHSIHLSFCLDETLQKRLAFINTDALQMLINAMRMNYVNIDVSN